MKIIPMAIVRINCLNACLASAEAPYMEIRLILFPTAVGEKEGWTVPYVDNALD